MSSAEAHSAILSNGLILRRPRQLCFGRFNKKGERSFAAWVNRLIKEGAIYKKRIISGESARRVECFRSLKIA